MSQVNTPVSVASIARPALLVVGLLLIATNLRAPITGVAPILETLRSTLTLSPLQSGLLTTLPLLAFGFISPFAAVLARTYGLERTLFGALIGIVAGVIVRSLGPVWCLYLGTGMLGAAIAVGNVLLPSLVKRDFPTMVPTITGICGIAMGGAAALASVSAVPLYNGLGWQAALGMLVVLPLVSGAVWSAQLGGHTPPAANTSTLSHGGPVWHSALAWQVTLFMGFNSLLYYILAGWLPAILIDAGFAPASAGSLHGAMQLASALPGLVLGPIVSRMKDQKLIAAATATFMCTGLLGLIFAPHWSLLWVCLFGAGSGGGVLLAFIAMGLRTRSAHQAATLSGMAQCVGYLLAACGPAVAGKAHDLTGGWHAPLAIGAVLAVAMAIFGVLAGRNRQIDTHTTR